MKGFSKDMGISASQARLLTITARLTQNEYESQQLSNAKMRLATKSEKASRDYIAALNSQSLQYVTYDAQGSKVSQDLTANILYSYSDLKNQYMISNVAGQALVLSVDAKNFRESRNLDEFLGKYGVVKEYKTDSLARNAERLQYDSGVTYTNALGETVTDGVRDYMTDWLNEIEKAKEAYYIKRWVMGNPEYISAEQKYELDKEYAREAYNVTSNEFFEASLAYQDNQSESNYDDLVAKTEAYNQSRADYFSCSTFEKWAQWKASEVMFSDVTFMNPISYNDGYMMHMVTSGYKDSGISSDNKPVYQNVQKYFDVINEFLTEAEELGCGTLEETYQYNDPDKAQWYTNLWYQMNGESSYKSAIGNNETNFAVLDSKLANSAEWIKDAISQGIITLSISTSEKVSNYLNTNITYNPLIQDVDIDGLMSNPLNVTLRGISWKAMEYTSSGDFIEKDDTKAIAKAQAEYEKITNEISIKDKKYESKIKTLDTEHNALQTEYQSVKSAMDKNIDRSYKTFNG